MMKRSIIHWERIEELLPMVAEDTPLTDKNLVELELLSNLAADYDEAHYPIKTPSLPDVLKLKMYERGQVARTMCIKLDISPNIVLGV